MRKLVVAALLTALAVPAPALAVDRQVSMKGNRLDPVTRTALPGEKVVWTNNELVGTTRHNVNSTQFPSSGDLLRGQSYEWTFATPGSYAYVCTHHRATMRGTVVVADLHLKGPALTLNHGATARFTGLARENTDVSLHAADGTQVASGRSGADGAFALSVPMVRPGTYYAAAGAATSRSVKVSVRPRLALNARRSGSRLVLAVAASPAQAGAPVVIQRRSGSRWLKIAGGRLNASSKATFRVARKAMTIRARTTRGVGGYTAATSRAIRVR